MVPPRKSAFSNAIRRDILDNRYYSLHVEMPPVPFEEANADRDIYVRGSSGVRHYRKADFERIRDTQYKVYRVKMTAIPEE